MIGLIQRVSEARVDVAGECTGAIGKGLLLLLGVARDDDEAKANRLVERICTYRVFSDADGKMNLNVEQVGGALLVVSQFTLVADTKKAHAQAFQKGQALSRGSDCMSMSSHNAVRGEYRFKLACMVRI